MVVVKRNRNHNFFKSRELIKLVPDFFFQSKSERSAVQPAVAFNTLSLLSQRLLFSTLNPSAYYTLSLLSQRLNKLSILNFQQKNLQHRTGRISTGSITAHPLQKKLSTINSSTKRTTFEINQYL